MSDFTVLKSQFNGGAGTDSVPVWNDILMGGSAGANEYRYCASGAGAAGTASASWPLFTRPGSVGVVPEQWGFSADTTGIKCLYDGTLSKSNVKRINFDAVGTFAAAPSLTAYSDTSHAAASPGTQPGAQSGSPVINGHATDTTSTSYLKGNMWGTVLTANLSAAAAGTTLAATSGSAGSVSPGVGAWLATWQSLQAATQFITFPSTPAATTAGDIYYQTVLFSGPNMATSALMQFTETFQYSYS